MPPPPPVPNLDDEVESLAPLQQLLTTPFVRGFCLRSKNWERFHVNLIQPITFNSAPFDSLVLPPGYKDLILAFVESQLTLGDAFEDVINGKGGGMVILLAGEPGVGKTLTAESVAERIGKPLYKLELGDAKEYRTSGYRRNGSDIEYRSDAGSDSDNEEIDHFALAAKWNAVLLIDECDAYLHKRVDSDPARNRLVTRFLHKLEYHPSLLFLTTNRTKSLDQALQSRVHLTINYPSLDRASRAAIWRTFLTRDNQGGAVDIEGVVGRLADVDINGRRIRNVVKTAQIMARTEKRPVSFEDVRRVLRITEGLEI
jgi:SpoVK/Ycf46/Vps4 family AAA+-type ATPase